MKRLLFVLALLAIAACLWWIEPIDPVFLRSQLQADIEK